MPVRIRIRRAVALNPDVVTDETAELILEARAFSNVTAGDPAAILARDGGQVLILAIGCRDLQAVHLLISVLANNAAAGFGCWAHHGYR